MRTTPVTDTLTQLTRLRFVNGYLVREDDGFTLIDTTVSRSGDALLAAAKQAGAPIRRIALTHGHGDHVGSLDELKTKLGDDVQVLMGELDARIHAGEKVVEGLRFPLAAIATFDRAQDLQSARELRALDPTTLVVGHGPAVRSPAGAIDAAIGRAGG